MSGTQVFPAAEGPSLLTHRMRLRAVSGPATGSEFEVRGSRLTVGSQPGNDVVIRDGKVSRRHFEIVSDEERYRIRDLGSTNGTKVDGVQVEAAVLAPGSLVAIGGSELRFEARQKWVRVGASPSDSFSHMTAMSALMGRVYELLARIAPTKLTCVLEGETGVGKEVLARAIVAESERNEKPFIVIDCGAIAGGVIEGELFGYEKGAFTDATRARAGAFELGNGGTVFLDEIGELPLELQAKLLRVLDRQEVRRLGATESTLLDVRVVAATHRSLAAMVEAGEFRQDLYYRLAEVVIHVPPLRERPEDILPLAKKMLQSEGRPSPPLSAAAEEWLISQAWPGNVRELRNCLRRAVQLGDEVIEVEHLTSSASKDALVLSAHLAAMPIEEARVEWTQALERQYLVRLLARCRGDLDRAADDAGVHRKSLRRLMRRHGLEGEDGSE